MLSPNGTTARRRAGAVCAVASVGLSMSCGGSDGDSDSTQRTTTTEASSTTVTTTDATSMTPPTNSTLDVPFEDGLSQRLISVDDLPSDWEAYEVDPRALPAELCKGVAGPVDATGMAVAGFSLATSAGDTEASLFELVIGFGNDDDAAAFLDLVTAAAVDCDLPPNRGTVFVPSGQPQVDDALGDGGVRTRIRAGTDEHFEQLFFRSGDVVVMITMTAPSELNLASMDGLDATIVRTAAG